MSVFIAIILWLVIAGFAYWLISLIGLADPFPSIIKAIFVLLAIYIVLAGFGVIGGGLPMPHIRL